MRGMVVSFRNLFIISGLLALAETAGAQSITGRVVGPGPIQLSGVRVTLPRLGLTATTGGDGSFELKLPNTGLIPMIHSGSSQVALSGSAGEISRGRDLLGKSTQGSLAYNRVLFVRGIDGRAQVPATADASAHVSASALLRSGAAVPDTMSFSKTGWFPKKSEMASVNAQNMGDIPLNRDIVAVGNTINDKYDQQIVDAYKNQGIDSSLAMVVKAMIQIESSGNANAISMWDTQLPCGTHSYGLIQVTPGCEKGYATLPGGTKVTATVSGGLNGNAAVIAWNDPADKTAGNTVVQEAGIIINLVTNPANTFWPTSAFNPAYSIDNGANALKNVMNEMKGRFNGCSASNYVQMGLAGYNQGSSTVSGCTSFSANGNNYQQAVLTQYRKYCTSAGITAIY